MLPEENSAELCKCLIKFEQYRQAVVPVLRSQERQILCNKKEHDGARRERREIKHVDSESRVWIGERERACH